MGFSAYSFSLVVISFSILLEYHETSAGVTFLVESTGPTKNTSALLAKVDEANLNEIQRTKGRLVSTKEKDVREAWRTERGDDVVKIQYLNKDPKQNLVERTTVLGTGGDGAIQNYIHGDKNGLVSYPLTSHRMKRTFWPFTSLFGYDYDYYPPPPAPGFGMFDSPFGGGFGGRPGFGGGGFGPGFGGGFGGGLGGPYGLPPPPSPFLGFTMGI